MFGLGLGAAGLPVSVVLSAWAAKRLQPIQKLKTARACISLVLAGGRRREELWARRIKLRAELRSHYDGASPPDTRGRGRPTVEADDVDFSAGTTRVCVYMSV